MSSTWGNHIKISIFGESHSKGIGIVIDGVPAGTVIDFSSLLLFMARRSSKGGKLDTPRLEKDFPQIQSGLLSDPKDPNRLIACGTPICALIENTNTQSKDYDQLRSVARPGHADYTGFVRYHGFNDIRGGGHFSGRLTAPLCFAGSIAKQYLRSLGIEVGAHIASIGSVHDRPLDPVLVDRETLLSVQEKFFPVLDDSAGEQMQDLIAQTRDQLDSVGGVIECAACGLPAGIGAAAARPGNKVVVLTGDGGLNYCLGEMAVLHEQNMDVKVVVLNNSILGWIKWYEAAMWDGRFTEVDTETIDYAAVARGLNCKGISIRDPRTLREELKTALELEGPVVIDITTAETEACKFTDDPKAVAYIRESAEQKKRK